MDRKEGYYWVLYQGEWQVANYFITENNGGYSGWYIFGVNEPDLWSCPHFQDKDFAEIDAEMIVRKGKVKGETIIVEWKD